MATEPVDPPPQQPDAPESKRRRPRNRLRTGAEAARPGEEPRLPGFAPEATPEAAPPGQPAQAPGPRARRERSPQTRAPGEAPVVPRSLRRRPDATALESAAARPAVDSPSPAQPAAPWATSAPDAPEPRLDGAGQATAPTPPLADASLPAADASLPAADASLPATDASLPAADAPLPAADAPRPVAEPWIADTLAADETLGHSLPDAATTPDGDGPGDPLPPPAATGEPTASERPAGTVPADLPLPGAAPTPPLAERDDGRAAPPSRRAPPRERTTRTATAQPPGTPYVAARARTITVRTAGLGAVTVRRLSLGAIASAAAHFRASGSTGDDSLVEALIAEAAIPVDRDAGARRNRLEASELEKLDDEDRDAIASAVLALEGVAPSPDGVPDVPRLMLAQRYTRIIGSGERVERAVREAVRPLAGRTDRLERTLSRRTVESLASQLAGSAALREALREDDWLQRLREHPEFSLDLEELLEELRRPEPGAGDAGQLPLFDAEAPADATAKAAGARSSPRSIERLALRVDDVAESQRQLLQWHAETKQTIASGITDLADRAHEADVAARMTRRLAWAAVAAAAVALLATIAWSLSLRGELDQTRARLVEAQERHAAEIADLRRAIAPPAAQRAPAKPTVPAPRKPANAR